MINQSHSQAQIFLNSYLQNRVRLINIEFNIQGCEHVKDNLKRSLYNFSLCLRRLLIVLTMLIATVTNRTRNNGLGETGYKTNTQIKHDTNGNDIIPITVTFDSIHASLSQCFSTAGPRPGTGPWHQLYRAARGLRKLQYATRYKWSS